MPKFTKYIEKMDGHTLLASGVEVPPKKVIVVLLHQVALSLRNNKLGSANSMMRSLLLDTGMPSQLPVGRNDFLTFTLTILYVLYFLLIYFSCISNIIFRYKVIVRVIDDTGSASLLLFDDLVYKLSGVQYGEQHEDYFPDELNIMVGKKLLFRIDYTDYNVNNNHHVYQVKMMSDEDTMINSFKAGFITEVFFL